MCQNLCTNPDSPNNRRRPVVKLSTKHKKYRKNLSTPSTEAFFHAQEKCPNPGKTRLILASDEKRDRIEFRLVSSTSNRLLGVNKNKISIASEMDFREIFLEATRACVYKYLAFFNYPRGTIQCHLILSLPS